MIKAKVASLLDERTLVLNKGMDSGVKSGMKFMIYAAHGKEIIDPDTKEPLGTLKLAKLPVEVTDVYPAYCRAETYRYHTVNEGGENSVLGGLSGYLSPPKYVRKYETFSIEEHTKRAINEEKSIIKVGDMAEEVVENSTEHSLNASKQSASTK